jgi:hypothetical protein
MHCCIIFYCIPYFGGSPSREATKTGVIYIYNQYVPRLTEEHMTLYSSVNREMYAHMAGVRSGGVSPVYSSVMCNRGIYSTIFIG